MRPPFGLYQHQEQRYTNKVHTYSVTNTHQITSRLYQVVVTRIEFFWITVWRAETHMV